MKATAAHFNPRSSPVSRKLCDCHVATSSRISARDLSVSLRLWDSCRREIGQPVTHNHNHRNSYQLTDALMPQSFDVGKGIFEEGAVFRSCGHKGTTQN